MNVIVELYRTRETDDAHAVVGREAVEAVDLDNAIEIAHLLSRTLDMPQRPDVMTITDAAGAVHYANAIEACASSEERKRS